MSIWTTAKWALWLSLYLVPALFIPWALTRCWSHYHGSDFRPGLRKLLQKGELSLLSMVIASPVIWHLMQSQFSTPTIAIGSVMLVITATMAGNVWVESYCRQECNITRDDTRVWRDSLNIALAVFAMATVIEILMDRLAKVGAL